MTPALQTVQYRTRQFFLAVRPRVSEADLAEVAWVLAGNRAAISLFRQMSPADQRHALAVWHTLQTWGHTHRALGQAALLHDVGKSPGQPLFHRVVIVLLEKFRPALLARLADAPLDCALWRRPFVVNAQHPHLGARWAQEAGCSPLVVSLIAMHQQKPATPAPDFTATLQAALYRADNLN